MPGAGDLQDISVAIGRLQAEVEHERRPRAQAHIAAAAMLKQLSNLATEVRLALSDMRGMREAIEPLQHEIELWRGLRNRAIGGMLVVGFLLSAGGAAAWSAFSKFFKGA